MPCNGRLFQDSLHKLDLDFPGLSFGTGDKTRAQSTLSWRGQSPGRRDTLRRSPSRAGRSRTPEDRDEQKTFFSLASAARSY